MRFLRTSRTLLNVLHYDVVTSLFIIIYTTIVHLFLFFLILKNKPMTLVVLVRIFFLNYTVNCFMKLNLT